MASRGAILSGPSPIWTHSGPAFCQPHSASIETPRGHLSVTPFQVPNCPADYLRSLSIKYVLPCSVMPRFGKVGSARMPIQWSSLSMITFFHTFP